MHKRIARSAAAITMVALSASCGRFSPGAAEAKAGSAGAHGKDHSAEAAFLFPDGNDRGWSHIQRSDMHHSAAPVPMSLLPPATRAKLIHQLALTSEVIRRYPTVAEARAAGYYRAGPFSPGSGVHYGGGGRMIAGDTLTDDDLLHPVVLIYPDTIQDAPIAGLMYLFEKPADPRNPREPEGFAGPNDRWHYHTDVCVAPRGDGTMFTFHAPPGEEQLCAAREGRMMAVTGYGLHVWVAPAYANPLGLFAHSNPAITCPDGSYFTRPENDTDMCAAPRKRASHTTAH